MFCFSMDSNGPSAVECRPPHNSDQLFVDLNEPPSSSSGSYEPKAHIGWASFGESIDPPSPANKTVAPVQLKRKVYVVRSQNRDKSKPYHIVSNKTRKTALDVIEPSKPEPTVMANNVSSDSDEDVDVVGIDDDDDTGSLISPAVQPTTVPLSLTSDLQLPPDLPPQPSFGSRFGMKAKRGELRQGYESDVDDLRFPGNLSPPPRLEPQTSDSTGILKAQDSISDGKTEESAPDEQLMMLIHLKY
uniref:Bestrophin homolog n=2 Tax=Caenorhabditis tropicalis TaxID=1561998 RepID=A0A1I7TIV5_9PELO